MKDDNVPVAPNLWHIVAFRLGQDPTSRTSGNDIMSAARENLGANVKVKEGRIPEDNEICPACVAAYKEYKNDERRDWPHGTRYVKIRQPIDRLGTKDVDAESTSAPEISDALRGLDIGDVPTLGAHGELYDPRRT